jgi:uncharacterized protein (TIGR02246 family)
LDAAEKFKERKMTKKFFAGMSMMLLLAATVFAAGKPAGMDTKDAADNEASAMAPAKVVKKAKPAKNDEAGIKKAWKEVSEAWSKGDAKGVASHFASDGSLITPFGKSGMGRAEIEKVVAEDLSIMNGSTQEFSDFKFRFILPGFALVDLTGTVSGMKAPDGTALPDKQFHIYAALALRGDKWVALAVRPYAFLAMPGAAAAAPAVAPAAAAPAAAITPAAKAGEVPAAPDTMPVVPATK